MSISSAQTLALEDFLKFLYLEEPPVWEYVDGFALQKPMPKTRHSILMFTPYHEPEVCRGSSRLVVLEGINLKLTAEQVFAWLKIDKR